MKGKFMSLQSGQNYNGATVGKTFQVSGSESSMPANYEGTI